MGTLQTLRDPLGQPLGKLRRGYPTETLGFLLQQPRERGRWEAWVPGAHVPGLALALSPEARGDGPHSAALRGDTENFHRRRDPSPHLGEGAVVKSACGFPACFQAEAQPTWKVKLEADSGSTCISGRPQGSCRPDRSRTPLGSLGGITSRFPVAPFILFFLL